MNKKASISLIVFLLIINIFLVYKYFDLQKDLEETKQELVDYKFNEKVLDFTNFFIKELLKSEGEVDFEVRLKLENLVRSLDDQEILAQWNNFTNSQTEIESQNQVKNLLELLINKISL
jgi:hypothetical protein